MLKATLPKIYEATEKTGKHNFLQLESTKPIEKRRKWA
jgi:hypothetical protein